MWGYGGNHFPHKKNFIIIFYSYKINLILEQRIIKTLNFDKFRQLFEKNRHIFFNILYYNSSMNKIRFENMPPALQEKALHLEKILKGYAAPFVIACSGGLDSRFLAFFAKQINCHFSLVHAAGKHIDAKETNYLTDWSFKNSLALTTVPLDIFELEQVSHNHKNRCYYCKLHTFKTFQIHFPNSIICDGTHAEDTTAYRPGLQALQELSIQSPLALANFTKQDIRGMGKIIGLENYQQKARPCLLTRFPYHTEIKEKILQQLIHLEDFFEQELIKIFGTNIPDFRIRYINAEFYFHYQQNIQKEALNTLQTALNEAKITSIRFEQLSKLSGYFDKNE